MSVVITVTTASVLTHLILVIVISIGYKEIFWMHIEKTSSWLYNFLMVWSCPDISSKVLHLASTGSASPLVLEKFGYFEEVNLYLKNHHQIVTQNMALKSFVMNCSVTFDAYSTGFGFHMPYFSETMNGSVITMIRYPMNRIISAFLFGIMVPSGSPYRKNGMNGVEVRKNVTNATIPILAYVNTPG